MMCLFLQDLLHGDQNNFLWEISILTLEKCPTFFLLLVLQKSLFELFIAYRTVVELDTHDMACVLESSNI